MNVKTKWLLFSIGGLLLVGAGLSVIGEAILLKGAGESFFWMGTERDYPSLGRPYC